MWFEAHDTLAKHPKTLRLARYLNVDRRYAVGVLHDLFSWGLTAATKDGTLKELTAADIAQALDFPSKKADQLVMALCNSGYLDKRPSQVNPDEWEYSIHDWYDYAGKLCDQREKNREKNKRYRDKARGST